MISSRRWLGGALALVACATAPTVRGPPPPTTQSDAQPSRRATETVLIAEPSAAAAAPTEAPLGIARCDDYLALYKACEPQLRPEIAAGERRPWAAERGRLEYLRDTPEGAELPAACDQMHRELLQRFGGGGSCANPVPAPR